LAAQESGLEMDENYHQEDIFELQHHHLLRCLEKTTVSQLCFIHQCVKYLVYTISIRSCRSTEIV
jgi:potassium voltage-gated channel Shal-related subfamily D protein